MNAIRGQLEKARLELLDLSARNRLVNTPLLAAKSASSIRVRDELAHEVYRLLVTEGKAMTFAAGLERKGDADSDEADLPQPDEGRHRDAKLQTGLTSKALQKRLLRMYYDARTFREEQGVNILYLALGFLRWVDVEGKERHAPLILIPVSLERQSAADKFKLLWTQEDADGNLTLAAKLDAEFQVKLPPPPDWATPEDVSLPAYFEAVREVTAGQIGWRVEADEILLGFFSFAKFLMYRDLDPANWPDSDLASHPLIAGLLGQGLTPASLAIPEDVDDLDACLAVAEIAHVVDADSSQTVAIHESRRGANLVIQGPPGTGKSQTIANLIASAVMDGKKVLFVAEKMAALEVVKRRLDAIGLGPICLEMHSNKVQKRAVLDELARTLNLGKPAGLAAVGPHAEIERARGVLNGHRGLMHDAIGPGEVSVYESIGILARLRRRGLDVLDLALRDPESWTPADRLLRKSLVGQLAEWIGANGLPERHAWRGVTCAPLLRVDVEILLAKLGPLEAALPEVLAASAPYGAFLDEAWRVSRHLAANPGLRAPCDLRAWRERRGEIRELVRKGAVLRDLRAKVDSVFQPAAWLQDVKETRHNLAAHGDGLFNALFGPFRKARNLLASLLKQPMPPTAAERVALLDSLMRAQAARAEFARLDGAAFGALWEGENSDFDLLARIERWVAEADVLDLLPRTVEATDVFAVLEKWRIGFAAVAEPLGYKGPPDAVTRWRADPEGLSRWTSYHALASDARASGLGALVDLLADGSVPANQALDRFASAYHTALLRRRAAEHPELAAFEGETHDRQVARFESLDRQLLDHNRTALLAKHYAGIPRAVGSFGPLGVLTAEIAKKRRHLPLRQLVKQAGPALQALKPVFLMSPLSIAQFLEPGALEFDLLVVDEASQVQPVDALGAMSRCRQAVVVGDDKQLPPTRFFSRMPGDEIEDEEAAASAGDVESILGLCRAKGFPERMLRWHYRSRHESLIAVSNHSFYEDRLFIIPSPFRAEGGLRFHLDPGHRYEPGAGVNREQAKAVAEAVIRHAKSHPAKTLGVGAFSVRQRDAILEELERLRRANPDCEEFFASGGAEPFFVKNLENVQGDERDVIFISVGYGRDANGVFSMRFGALNGPGGERRLNVLISRAKLRCEVFTSITGDDIDPERARGLGVAALRTFLLFAQTGRLPATAALAGAKKDERRMVDDVAAVLREAGHEVVEQFGLAGLFVELAVVDPLDPTAMLLGIEMDGAEYRKARSARDRDRLRATVLERQGWRLHRIWSVDWYQRPNEQTRKLLAAVEQAVQDPRPVREPEVEIVIQREEEEAPAPPDALQYVYATIQAPANLDPREVPLALMIELVEQVIAVEGPVHEDEVIARIRQAFGLARAGIRAQQAIRKALEAGVGQKRFERVEERFYRKEGCEVKARAGASRKAELIAASELDAAILEGIAANLGATRDQIPLLAARMLGFRSTSAQLRSLFEARVEVLLAEGRLAERSGLVTPRFTAS
jgi:hypothetical protein